MPITVNGPNGIVINFPDGTDSAVIDREMRRIVVDTASGEPVSGQELKARAGIGEPLTLDTAVRQVAKGMPVIGGAMENIAAAGDAATQPVLGRGSEAGTFGERYGENLKREQAIDVAAEKGNPGATTALNIAGGVAGTAPLGLFGLGQRALGLVGSLPGRVMQGAAGGGILGAADAYTRGNSPVVGGGFGATVGAAAPVLGKGVGALVEKAADATRPVGAPLTEFARPAVKKVSRAFGDDVVTAERAAELGPQGMLVDLGPNLRSQGEVLSTQPGSASKRMEDAVKSRFTGADTRIKGEVDKTLGNYQNFRDTKQAAIKERKASGNDLYGEAFANARPVDVTPAVQYIDDRIRPGLSALAEGGPSPDSIQSVLGRVRNVLAGGGARRIDAQDLHVVKMDMDDAIESAVRGGKNNQARELINVRDRIVGSLNDSTDGLYGQAMGKYRSDSKVINALDEGRGIFSKGTRPDDLLASVKEMSEAERHAFQIGARDAVDEVMGNVKNDALAARNLFGKDWNQQKLEAVVGKEKAAQLLQTIERENIFAETYGAVQRGSQTRGRLAAGEEFPNKVAQTATQLVNPSVLGLGELALRKSLDLLRTQGRTARLDREGSDAARMLTAQGDPRDALIQALREYGARQAEVGPTAERARNLITMLGASAPPPVQSRLAR